jgi:hypothetical protein
MLLGKVRPCGGRHDLGPNLRGPLTAVVAHGNTEAGDREKTFRCIRRNEQPGGKSACRPTSSYMGGAIFCDAPGEASGVIEQTRAPLYEA